ncbi:MAG: ATP-dependent helicase HrpB [Bacteroidales bacterium]|nr:ATP-dependent helicase HrpB [Bacteroidales bacterium]
MPAKTMSTGRLSRIINSALPAYGIAEEVNRILARKTRLIITAPPGAGKSTVLPLTILEGFPEGKILMLEPRRVAARQIAERMAWLAGEPVGQKVGYRVRNESRVSRDTRIEVITEGILTRMLIEDPTLDGVEAVIFDEFHERSIHSDEALALTRQSQALLREDLSIIIMSATIDTEALATAMQAPVIKSEGRMFPVEIKHTAKEATPENVSELVAHYIREAHKTEAGDILAFLPGEGEIHRCEELLGTALGATHICPLYGMLSNAAQKAAIAPSGPGERKVVLATPVAETSLTIEGVKIVIDSGLYKHLVVDARSGLSHLETERISLDMATQRSGRAGRVAPGVCYRLWSSATEARMPLVRTPEILHADLAPLVLDAAAWGAELASLPWLTPPPAAHVSESRKLLQSLGALSADGCITPFGRRMVSQPCHPRLAAMLLRADTPARRSLARRLADLLEERRDPQLEDLKANPYEVGLLLAAAYPERIGKAYGGPGQFLLASGDRVAVEGDWEAQEWLVVASMSVRPGGVGRAFLVAPLAAEDLSGFASERDVVLWDKAAGAAVARREKRIGVLVLDSRPLSEGVREELVQVIVETARKEGTSLFDFSTPEVGLLQLRVAWVAARHPSLSLPDLSTEAVLKRADEWVPLYIGKATTVVQLKKIDLSAVLWGLLSYEQQQAVERIAPTHITVPTGSHIALEYRQGADAPVLRVRLQECFGLTDTPRVDGSPILMELLSPGFKPVQLTSDLSSFWSGTYFEVRKELRRRYPKHYWPDNPLEAEPVRGVKKKA